MDKEQNKINMSLLTFIFIFYIMFILINDYFCFFFRTNFNAIFYVVSLLICSSIVFLLRKKIKINKIDFNRLDIVLILLLLWVYWVRMVIPDSSFDTLNYHLYLQNRPFSNNATYNFFPARWINTFSFPLGDRMHYFIRYLLGYRLGNILNIFILIIIYYQIKYILGKFINNKTYISLISCVIIVTEQILNNMITYYVDLFAIPIILEMLIIITSKDKKCSNHSIYLLLLAGIVCSLKISNAFFIIPLAIIYIIKNYKTINFRTIIIGGFLFFLPLFVYAVNNYIQTRNPVFPFYNHIFKSGYYLNHNWVEKYYGPKKLVEKLLWPIYIMWHPRRTHDIALYYNRLSYGYITALIVLIIVLYKKIVKKYKIDDYGKLNIFFIVICLIWSNFVLGYIRYALFLEILAGIIMAIFLYKSFNSKKILSAVLFALCSCAFMYTFFNTTSDIFKTSNEMSWRNPYYLDKLGYKKNKKYLYSKNLDYSSKIKDIDCIGVVDYNSGYASMLFKDNRILGLNEGYYTEYGKEKLEEIKRECKNIYTISTKYTVETTEKNLLMNGYQRAGENIEFRTEFTNYYNSIVMFEIKDKEPVNAKTAKKK